MLVADINKRGAQETAEKSKQHATHPDYRAVSVTVDVTDAVSVQGMVDVAVKEFGRIDYSVNSAGVRFCLRTSPGIEIALSTCRQILAPMYIATNSFVKLDCRWSKGSNL